MSSYVARSFPLEEEYKKPTGITPQDIATLRQWLATQPHLPQEHITDLDLILALHSCNRCMETTKKLLDTHFTMKTAFTTIFKDRLVDDKIELVLKRVLLNPLPTRTKDGDAVLYTRLLDTEPKNYLFQESLRAVIMLLELWQYEEGTWPGLIIVYDLSGLKFGHVFKLEMETVKQFLTFLDEAVFIKIKSIHVLNAPLFTDYLLMLVRKFMRSELLDVFTIHQKGSKSIENFIDVTELPKESGGSYRTYEQCREATYLKMTANKDFFIMENKKRVNERLRPDTKTPSDGEKKLTKKYDID